MKKWLFFFFTLLFFLALDRWTKSWALSALRYAEPVPVLPFFNFTLLKNTGMAFSLGQNQNAFFIGSTILLALVLFIYSFYHKPNWPLALILSGALGNLYDRIYFHGVIDFLDFYVGTYHWPAFNVADSCVCVGAALLFLFEWRGQSVSR